MAAEDESLLARTLGGFLDAVASTTEPVPAGGSVTAVTGAAAAGLLALVCRVLVERERTDLLDPALAKRRDRAEALERQLRALVDADAESYRVLIRALALPRGEGGDSAERATRREAVQRALVEATRVPLAIARGCADVERAAEQLRPITTGAVVGDVRAAHRLAGAARQAALDLAEENIEALRDPAAREALSRELEQLRIGGTSS